jgi:DNA-binding LytR/AlgR family response regulator
MIKSYRHAFFLALLSAALVYPNVNRNYENNIEELISILKTQSKKLPPDSVLSLAESIKRISLIAENLKGQIHAEFAAGLSYLRKGANKESLSHLREAESLALKAGDTLMFYLVKNSKSMALKNEGSYQKAKSELLRTQQWALKNKRLRLLAKALNNLGILEKYAGNFDEAIKYYQEALTRFESFNDALATCNTLLNISVIHARMNHLKDAIELNRKALSLAMKMNNAYLVMKLANNMGGFFRNLQNADSSNYYYRLTKKEAVAANALQNIALVDMNLGINYSIAKNYIKATEYMQNALRISKKIGFHNGALKNYTNLGYMYYEQKQYDRAVSYTDSALIMAGEQKLRLDLENIYGNLALIYEAKKEFENAYKFQTYLAAIKDSLRSIEKIKTVNEILTKYRVEKLTGIVREQKETVFLYQNGFLISAGILTILLVLMVFIYKKYFLTVQNIRRLTSVKIDKEKRIEELNAVIQELRDSETTANVNNSYLLKNGVKINFSEVVYIKAEGHYLRFNILEQKISEQLERNRLKTVKPLFPHPPFVQIHRSYIVNLEYVHLLTNDSLILKSKQCLPVSRTYRQELFAALNAR